MGYKNTRMSQSMNALSSMLDDKGYDEGPRSFGARDGQPIKEVIID